MFVKNKFIGNVHLISATKYLSFELNNIELSNIHDNIFFIICPLATSLIRPAFVIAFIVYL